MSTTAYSGSGARPMAGWIVFAATMMMVIGSIDFFEGLIAVIRGEYYVIHGDQLIVFDTTTWGWITMILGVILFLFEVGLVATLQAFIFATLTAIYLGGAVAEEH